MTGKEIGMKALDKFITLVIMIVVALITVSLTTKQNEIVIEKEKLDKKLDRTEYIEKVKIIDNEMAKKASIKYVDHEIDELKGDILYLRGKSDDIYNVLLDIKDNK